MGSDTGKMKDEESGGERERERLKNDLQICSHTEMKRAILGDLLAFGARSCVLPVPCLVVSLGLFLPVYELSRTASTSARTVPSASHV